MLKRLCGCRIVPILKYDKLIIPLSVVRLVRGGRTRLLCVQELIILVVREARGERPITEHVGVSRYLLLLHGEVGL
jgi:hypothetical protein